jgi:hypothetical protein
MNESTADILPKFDTASVNRKSVEVSEQESTCMSHSPIKYVTLSHHVCHTLPSCMSHSPIMYVTLSHHACHTLPSCMSHSPNMHVTLSQHACHTLPTCMPQSLITCAPRYENWSLVHCSPLRGIPARVHRLLPKIGKGFRGWGRRTLRECRQRYVCWRN